MDNDFSNMTIRELATRANEGDTAAQIAVSRRFIKHGHSDFLARARYYMELAAQKGDVGAQFEVACMFLDTTYGKPKPEQALAFFRKADAQGYAPATAALQKLDLP